MPIVSTKNIDETNRKRRTRTEAGSCRQIAIVLDLDALRHAIVTKDITNGRMLDLFDLLGKLDQKLGNPALTLTVLPLKHNDSAKLAAILEFDVPTDEHTTVAVTAPQTKGRVS